MTETNVVNAPNFIKNIIEDDLQNGKCHTVITRFPPEPNGYLHIGHAKAICINFGLAQEFSGQCNLRFDDTNPEKENDEYVRSIEENIQWLGFNWSGKVKYASDYFPQLYEFALYFIEQGLAYVCDLTADEMRDFRGSFTEPGRNSPYRERSVAQNMDLFLRMKNGEFADGSKTLRLKIDMGSPNINLRDPVIYRIKRFHHIRTQDEWCIYPMYDYTHSISDALEGITHSCCSLEFEDHRPLYDWVVSHLVEAGLLSCHPQQIEFSRLQLQYTVTSKRKLSQLINEKIVASWDDPRLPTLAGMRRRGYTPDGIKLFIKRCGVSKSPNIMDVSLLEGAMREDLESKAPRIMAVLNPLKVRLINFDENMTSSRSAHFHPQNTALGERIVELTGEIYIEQDDFLEVPVDKWQRLTVGQEVRLRHSYVIKCVAVIKNAMEEIIELHCVIDHDTLGKNPVGRKVKGVIHWVSTTNSIPITVRNYERLFSIATPELGGKDFKDFINPDSLSIFTAHMEPLVTKVEPGTRFQFERLGYYVADLYDCTDKHLVFNRIVSLKDSWNPLLKIC
ncbi:MAG: glutamine--tRNA ligase/YqeY domain fusion protein [Burkholderiales bacterium]|nr:glutamine--tRNA ligase/YqeY domain fusion protein [Burkholderiales bacterium]